jgi:hypothetical protein
MPTILYVQRSRLHLYSNEGNEPDARPRRKGRCRVQVLDHPSGPFRYQRDFEYNCTPRLRREVQPDNI